MEVITERIQRIYEESGFRSVRAFALYAGINVGTFNDTLKKGNEPRFALLETILKCCPKVSAEWLMRGEGGMYRDGHESSKATVSHEPIINKSNNTAADNGSIVASGNIITADKSVLESLQRENSMLQAQLDIANEQLRKKDEQMAALFSLINK